MTPLQPYECAFEEKKSNTTNIRYKQQQQQHPNQTGPKRGRGEMGWKRVTKYFHCFFLRKKKTDSDFLFVLTKINRFRFLFRQQQTTNNNHG